MKINKTYKYRIYPNKTQIETLAKWFGSCRFVYNHFLNEKITQYKETGKADNYYAQQHKLTILKKNDDYKWLKDVNAQTLQLAVWSVNKAYKNFFEKRTKFPQFHKKNSRQSFKIIQNVKITQNRFYMFKFDEGIKCKIHRQLDGTICCATIVKYPSGKYYVNILTEQDIEIKQKEENIIGIDLGIKSYITTSDGIKYDNPRYINKFEEELRVAQQWLSKKQLGSRQFEKQKLKVAKIQEKITNCRNDFQHKLSKKLVDNNSVIYIEDLDIKGIRSYRSLNKEIWDTGWKTFIDMLIYKSKLHSCDIRKIDRWFPSSKTCCNCGYVNNNLKLSDREWVCPKCSTKVDRDINAAQNILLEGIKKYSKSLGTSDYTDGNYEVRSVFQ